MYILLLNALFIEKYHSELTETGYELTHTLSFHIQNTP